MAEDAAATALSDMTTTQPPSNPDAQATVNDFLDYTEFFPSDLVRSLTLIGKLDQDYLDATQTVHDLTKTYGILPQLPTDQQPDPVTLRKNIAQALDHAIYCRESTSAEANRLYEVAERHCHRLAIIKRKLQALPQPPSRDPTPVPVSPAARRYDRTPRVYHNVENGSRLPGSAARPRDRSRKALPRAHSPDLTSIASDGSESDAGSNIELATNPRREKSSKGSKPKSASARARPPGVMGTNVHSQVAGISTSNALAKLSPPPADAKPGSAHAPWLKLTEYEMAVLRKQMKKNAIWCPSDTMIRRELSKKGRGQENYEKEKARCEATGETFLDEDPAVPSIKQPEQTTTVVPVITSATSVAVAPAVSPTPVTAPDSLAAPVSPTMLARTSEPISVVETPVPNPPVVEAVPPVTDVPPVELIPIDPALSAIPTAPVAPSVPSVPDVPVVPVVPVVPAVTAAPTVVPTVPEVSAAPPASVNAISPEESIVLVQPVVPVVEVIPALPAAPEVEDAVMTDVPALAPTEPQLPPVPSTPIMPIEPNVAEQTPKEEANTSNRNVKSPDKLKREARLREQATRDAQILEDVTQKLMEAGDKIKNIFAISPRDTVAVTPIRKEPPRSARKRRREPSPPPVPEVAQSTAGSRASSASHESGTKPPGPKRIRTNIPIAPAPVTVATPVSTPALVPIVPLPAPPTPHSETPVPLPPSPIKSSTVQVPLAPAGPSTPTIVKVTPKVPSRKSSPAPSSPTENKKPQTAVPVPPTATAASSRPRRESVAAKSASSPPPQPPKAKTPTPAPEPISQRPVTRPRSARGHVPAPKAASAEPPAPTLSRTRDLRRASNVSLPAAPQAHPTRASTRRKPPPTGDVTAGEDGQNKVTVSKRSRGSKHSRGKKPEGETEPLEVIDPNEPRYCICDDVSYGTMISCDNQVCLNSSGNDVCTGCERKLTHDSSARRNGSISSVSASRKFRPVARNGTVPNAVLRSMSILPEIVYRPRPLLSGI